MPSYQFSETHLVMLSTHKNNAQFFIASGTIKDLVYIAVKLGLFLHCTEVAFHLQPWRDLSSNLSKPVKWPEVNRNLLLTELEVRTVSYVPIFFPFNLSTKHEARGL